MADNQNFQPSTVIAKLYGSDVRRIQQLTKEGVIVGHGRPAKYDLLPTIMALFKYQRDIIQGKEKNKTISELEEEKLMAEVAIKKSKAEAAKLELKELQGKMHRAEDVESITTDHVLFFRSMLSAMPGKLAVDCANCKTAAEAAGRIQQEVYYILDELSNYRYDPEEYKKRVRERQGWESEQRGNNDDE